MLGLGIRLAIEIIKYLKLFLDHWTQKHNFRNMKIFEQNLWYDYKALFWCAGMEWLLVK